MERNLQFLPIDLRLYLKRDLADIQAKCIRGLMVMFALNTKNYNIIFVTSSDNGLAQDRSWRSLEE